MAPKRAKAQIGTSKTGPAAATRSKGAKSSTDEDSSSGTYEPPKSGVSLSSQAYAFTGPLATLPFEILVMIIKALASSGWQGGKVGP